jgi:hypothetical protein
VHVEPLTRMIRRGPRRSPAAGRARVQFTVTARVVNLSPVTGRVNGSARYGAWATGTVRPESESPARRFKFSGHVTVTGTAHAASRSPGPRGRLGHGAQTGVPRGWRSDSGHFFDMTFTTLGWHSIMGPGRLKHHMPSFRGMPSSSHDPAGGRPS